MKVAVSACLLGERCRYDGASKKDSALTHKLQDHEIVPFCPEAPVLGTPRVRINIIKESGLCRLLQEGSGKDVTELIKNETVHFLALHHDIEIAVLKSKSPSCGLGTTPHYNKEMCCTGMGNGVAAELFMDKLGKSAVFDEHGF